MSSSITYGQFRCDGHTIQTLYGVVISCENISSIFITLQAIKFGPKLEVSQNKSYFHIKGSSLSNSTSSSVLA